MIWIMINTNDFRYLIMIVFEDYLCENVFFDSRLSSRF